MSNKLLMRVGAFVFGLTMLTALAVAPVCAQEEGAPRVVDEVIAQVNDQVVTLSMLKREMKNAKESLKQQAGMTEEQAQTEVNKRQPEIILALINEQLIMENRSCRLSLHLDYLRLSHRRASAFPRFLSQRPQREWEREQR